MGKEGWARSVPRRRLEARPGGRYDLRVVSATGRSLADCRIRRISPGAGTHLSAAVSRALHRRLVALVVIDVSGGLIRGSRARATLGTFHGPSPPSPRFRPRQKRPVAPLSRREFSRETRRARTDRSTPARPLRGRDAHLERVCASPRRGFRYAGRRATADVRVAREMRSPRAPRDENPASQGTTRRAVVAGIVP